MNEINWKPLPSEKGLNLSATSLFPDHYCTGTPNLGWVLYSKDGRGCSNQRTEREFAPESELIPIRIDGKWFWMPEPPKPEVSYEVRSKKTNIILECPRLIEDAHKARDLYARNNPANTYTIWEVKKKMIE